MIGRNATVEEALPRELGEARFSRLYRDHQREILRYALRRSAEPQDAAEEGLGCAHFGVPLRPGP